MITKQKLIEFAEKAGFIIDRHENVSQNYVIQATHIKIDDELAKFAQLLGDAKTCPVCSSKCDERDKLIKAEREIETLRAALADAVF